MALFRTIQEYIARDANNSARVEKELSNIMYYDPYRAFGSQNKIVYSTRLVRRATFF